MGTIPEEVLLYKIKQETAAREAAIAALLSQLDNATEAAQQKITAVASKLSANINGRTVNSSAIAGVILTSQVAPGFAYASELTLLEAKVTSDALLSVARITELREVTATEFEAKAQQILTIQATFNASKAKFTEDILANANATSAVTTRTTTLEATVNNPTSGVVASSARITAEETTRATQTSALATRSTALEATVNNPTTGVAATLARLVTEETTRATADTAVANRTTTLESTVNNGTTGVAATSARLTTEENTRATQTSALASRATTLESTVNNPTTGVAAAIARITAEESTRASADSAISSTVTTLTSTVNTNNLTLTAAINNEASTRASQDTAISNTVSSLTSTVNGNTANITTLQTTTASQSSAISTLQTTVSSHGTSITTAQNTANSAQSAANAAQATANAKATTFSQGTAPTANAVGDLWIDTANNNQIKRWNGSSWVDASDVRIVSLQSSITTLQSANTTQDSTIASLTTTVSAQSTSISNAQNTANSAQSAANAAQNTANVATAAVTTEATARANADGTLSARASLSLDVNGNVAGYKIGSDVNLAGVTTSEFSITADTFKIYNGSSKVSPFSVSGGVVSMVNVKVTSSLDIGSGFTQTRIDSSGLKVGQYVEFNTDGLDTFFKFTPTYNSNRGMNLRSGTHDSSIRVGFNLFTNLESLGFYADTYGSTIRTLTVYDGLSVTGGNLSVANAATINGNTYSGSFSSNGNASFGSLNISSYASLNGASFSNSGFNLHPSSDNSMSTGEDGGAYGAQTGAYLAMRVNGRTVWVPFFTALP
jgi:hypothetical protein